MFIPCLHIYSVQLIYKEKYRSGVLSTVAVHFTIQLCSQHGCCYGVADMVGNPARWAYDSYIITHPTDLYIIAFLLHSMTCQPTCFSGLQFDDGGSGGIGAPSLNKEHVSLGTSGRCLTIISAVSLARIISDTIILSNDLPRFFNLSPVRSAWILASKFIKF